MSANLLVAQAIAHLTSAAEAIEVASQDSAIGQAIAEENWSQRIQELRDLLAKRANLPNGLRYVEYKDVS